MIKNREGYLISDTHRQCTNCKQIFVKTSKTVTLCNICNSNRVKSASLESKMVQRAKQRARVDNLPFNLERSDIIIPERCPILDIKLISHKGRPGGNVDSPALDKIEPLKGYVKGNIRVISHLANMMKSCATNEELLKFSNWVINNIPDNSGQN